MVRHYVRLFVYAFVFSGICEGQSDGVFIVYPFKEGDINQSKSKFTVRKFENEVRKKPKMLTDTNLYLIYPNYENIFIMTPAPMPIQESDETFLDTTTMKESSTELLSDFIATEANDTYSQSGDIDLGSTIMTPTPMPIQESDETFLDTTTMKESSAELLSDFITTTEAVDTYSPSGDIDMGSTKEIEDAATTVGDIDLSTDFRTTEIPIQYIQKSPVQKPSLVDIIYEETGPKKILRKRMFEAIKFSRKYPSGLKMTNDMKIPTTMSPNDAFENWYRKTNKNKARTISEKLGTTKTLLKNSTGNNTTETKIQ